MSLYDDAGIGRILSRRELLTLLGAAGAGAIVGAPGLASLDAQVPGCVVVPAQMEGPYFVDTKLNRSDIRTDPGTKAESPGVPLRVSLRVLQMSAAGACTPLAGALVDLWQCDALGVYSDFQDDTAKFDARGKRFLRGYQLTDAKGAVGFTTIYPGWYPGRAVHLHFKVRTNPSGPKGTDFTSQLYFNEAVTDKVHARAPYSSKGRRTTTNDRDGIYTGSGGRQLMLNVTEGANGFAGTFDLAVKI
jgi:protocatechuate 3,4-dioxygenase beta subunit